MIAKNSQTNVVAASLRSDGPNFKPPICHENVLGDLRPVSQPQPHVFLRVIMR